MSFGTERSDTTPTRPSGDPTCGDRSTRERAASRALVPVVLCALLALVPAVLAPLTIVSPAHAQGAEGDAAAEQQPLKNIKLLTGKSRKEITEVMKAWSKALGVKCSHCHVKDYAADEKPEKRTAREMLVMLNDINDKYPLMEKKGTCYMCHRGTKEPHFEPEPGATH